MVSDVQLLSIQGISVPSPVPTAIIDDSVHNRNLAKALLKKFFSEQITIVGEAQGVDSGVELVRSTRPELLLLDIDLHGRTCFEMLDMLSDIRGTFTVTFISSYEKYIRKGLEYGVVSFIDKPFVHPEFIRGINLGIRSVLERQALRQRLIEDLKIELQNKNSSLDSSELLASKPENGSFSRNSEQELSNERATSITIKRHDGADVTVMIDTILYCSADGSYTHIHCRENIEYVDSKPLKRYEELLAEHGFMRISRAMLVNPHYCRLLPMGNVDVLVVLPDGGEVYAEGKYREQILAQM